MTSSSFDAGANRARCAKRWFPPATFQLRARSIGEVVFVLGGGAEENSSPSPSFHFTLQLSFRSEVFYRSEQVSISSCDDRVRWREVEVPERFGSCKSCFVKVWKTEGKEHAESMESSSTPCFVASLHLNGLVCLGIHLPPMVRPHPALVLQLAGSYFLAASAAATAAGGSGGGDRAVISRHLFFGPFQPNKVLDSYSASLLCRLLRLHRAMAQQSTTNGHFRETLERRGLCDDGERFRALSQCRAASTASSTTTARGRLLLDRAKEPSTRMSEAELRRQVEEVRIKIHLCKLERASVEAQVARRWAAVNSLQREIDEMTTLLMNKIHNLSRDKQGFLEWRERQRVFRGGGGGEGRDSSPSNPSDVVDLGLTHGLTRAVQASQYGLLTSLRVLYPVQNPTQVQPTMRWVTLPSLERACSNSREETALSVTLGWVAHVLCTVSALLDVSLRYPIVYRGSQTVILDPSKGDGRDQEFPLFARRVEVARTDYAIFLLNKDLAQIRWLCGLVTADLKLTLRNLHELLSLGDGQHRQHRQQQKQLAHLSRHPHPLSSRPSSSLRLLSPPPRADRGPSFLDQRDLAGSSADEMEDDGKDGAVATDQMCDLKEGEKGEEEEEEDEKNVSEEKDSLEQKDGEEIPEGGKNSWGEFANRTKALSIPTSFQRKNQKKVADATRQSSSSARPW